jgi:Zn-dependent M28 family amino/carboxypeptidase
MKQAVAESMMKELPRAVQHANRYAEDLRFVAAIRPPGSPHWQAVQDRCFTVFEAAGFSTVRFEVEGAGISVIGRKDGSKPELPGIVVGAHYDHIADCPGADDNASGTAAVLELARVLGTQTWERSLTVACWDEEETGLHGSRAWVDAAVADGRTFALYLNFDAMAYTDTKPNTQKLPPGIDMLFAKQVERLAAREFRADFIAVLADASASASSARLVAHANRLELPVALLEVPQQLMNEPLLADLRRSDHANFWQHHIPAVFLSDTANLRTDTYHCTGRPDTVETLDLGFATKVVRAAAGALSELLAELPE